MFIVSGAYHIFLGVLRDPLPFGFTLQVYHQELLLAISRFVLEYRVKNMMGKKKYGKCNNKSKKIAVPGAS